MDESLAGEGGVLGRTRTNVTGVTFAGVLMGQILWSLQIAGTWP